jgi:hypothetical protein
MLRQPHNNHRASLIIGQSTPVRSPVPGARKKRLHFERLIFLMPLGAIVVIVYRLQALPADTLRQAFEGFGAAISVAACGGVLLWRVTRALAIEERSQAQLPAASPASVSSSEPNPAELQINQNSSPPEAATAPAAPVASLPIKTRT